MLVLQELGSVAQQWLALVSLSLVAGESLRHSRFWLLVVLIAFLDRVTLTCSPMVTVSAV